MKQLGDIVSQNHDIIVHFTKEITLITKAYFFFLLSTSETSRAAKTRSDCARTDALFLGNIYYLHIFVFNSIASFVSIRRININFDQIFKSMY